MVILFVLKKKNTLDHMFIHTNSDILNEVPDTDTTPSLNKQNIFEILICDN